MEWLTLIGGLAAGFAGGYTIKTVITVRRSADIANSDVGSRTGSVTQRDNRVGGSIAGRDINRSK